MEWRKVQPAVDLETGRRIMERFAWSVASDSGDWSRPRERVIRNPTGRCLLPRWKSWT
jgi:hypothetical protein